MKSSEPPTPHQARTTQTKGQHEQDSVWKAIERGCEKKSQKFPTPLKIWHPSIFSNPERAPLVHRRGTSDRPDQTYSIGRRALPAALLSPSLTPAEGTECRASIPSLTTMDHMLTLRHAELQLRTLAKRSADLCVCLMHRVGIEHANRFNSELCRVDWPQKAGGLSWDWQSGPPCPFKGAWQRCIRGMRRRLEGSRSVCFSLATRGTAYTATKEQIESGLMVASERLGDIGLRQVGENTLRRAYVGGFMRGLADGIGMHSPNRYTIFEAIAHRYMILDIVQYIDEGKLNTARRVLKEIPSCEAKANHKSFRPRSSSGSRRPAWVTRPLTQLRRLPSCLPLRRPVHPQSARCTHCCR